MEFFIVGGAVRDEIMGISTKDVDFSVVVPEAETVGEAFDMLRTRLQSDGFTIHVEKPEFLTIRAGVPAGHALRAVTKDADFVIAREDGPSCDGRRPDWVKPGDLLADLSRRDFTVNAIAKAVDGTIVDPFDGRTDIENRVLRFVGTPEDRITEDGLRVIRGFRFMVMKGLRPDLATLNAMISPLACAMLRKVSTERIRDELERMLAFDTLGTLLVMEKKMPPEMLEVIFGSGLRLSATMKS